MIKTLLLATSLLAVTPTLYNREMWSCVQYTEKLETTDVYDILNTYGGNYIALDFDTTSNDLYNPLRNEPMLNTTNYYFYFQFDLTHYSDGHDILFPYFVMSFDNGNNWQQIAINDDASSLNFYCTYDQLSDILIMYQIQYYNRNEVDIYFENWQVTFFTDNAFADFTSDEYQTGYNTGYSEGYQNGYTLGNNTGYDEGYQIGYGEGADSDITTNGMQTMLNTIVSYPINFLKTAFNFELFGINISALIMFVLSCGIVIWVINKFRK